ncbi:MAG: DsbA family protein [Gammaproteobacteria bacterium]|nr:DsbA family protein [Gammaproteobacteria bacterium]MDE2348534.1 DsbA family protein [Gammaproteobacteria bacterium]
MTKLPYALASIGLAMAAIASSAAPDAGAQPPAASTPIAKIGDQTIEFKAIEPKVLGALANLDKARDQQIREITLAARRNRAAYLSAQADALVDRRILAIEAASRHTTREALLGAVKVPAVTDADMHAFYDAHRDAIGKPYDAIAPQLRVYLESEAKKTAQKQYLEGLRAKYHASVLLEPLREQVAATGPARGPVDAPVTIVEFSDFQCPYCGRFEPELAKLMKAHPGKIRLVYRNLPIPSLHPDALIAAEAGQCARAQGKFWEMHDLMFAEQNALSKVELEEKAKRLGLDTKHFDACLDANGGLDAIQADEAAGDQLGLSATPSTFVNGRFVNGAVSYAELDAIVEDELRRASSPAKR